MRRLALGAVLVICSMPAHAAGPQVTDPTGDANGTGVVAPAPASLPAFDITSVRWWADASAQRVTVTMADTPGEGWYTLTWATPSCATNMLQFRTGWDTSYLEGCKPRHRRWYKPAVVSGRTVTFTMPRRELPSWLAAGTALSKLGADTESSIDFQRGDVRPPADHAYADVKYVVGT